MVISQKIKTPKKIYEIGRDDHLYFNNQENTKNQKQGQKKTIKDAIPVNRPYESPPFSDQTSQTNSTKKNDKKNNSRHHIPKEKDREPSTQKNKNKTREKKMIWISEQEETNIKEAIPVIRSYKNRHELKKVENKEHYEKSEGPTAQKPHKTEPEIEIKKYSMENNLPPRESESYPEQDNDHDMIEKEKDNTLDDILIEASEKRRKQKNRTEKYEKNIEKESKISEINLRQGTGKNTKHHEQYEDNKNNSEQQTPDNKKERKTQKKEPSYRPSTYENSNNRTRNTNNKLHPSNFENQKINKDSNIISKNFETYSGNKISEPSVAESRYDKRFPLQYDSGYDSSSSKESPSTKEKKQERRKRKHKKDNIESIISDVIDTFSEVPQQTEMTEEYEEMVYEEERKNISVLIAKSIYSTLGSTLSNITRKITDYVKMTYVEKKIKKEEKEQKEMLTKNKLDEIVNTYNILMDKKKEYELNIQLSKQKEMKNKIEKNPFNYRSIIFE